MLFFSRLPLRFYFLCFFLKLAIFIFLPNLAYSAEVSLAWDPNTETDLAGYKIYYGSSSRNYEFSIDVSNIIPYTISSLENGRTYYFAATAYNTSGYESEYSNEVVYNIPLPCTYSISPTVQSFTESGGADKVSVTASSGCSWGANSNANWLVLTSNSNGTGNSVVDYSVLVNTDISSRTGTLSIAGQTFTVTQAGVPKYTLTLTKGGTGFGTITSYPTGTTFKAGTVVTLTAIPNANSTFEGWSGGCTGIFQKCAVTMNANTTVTAPFTLKTYKLMAIGGTGGSITPSGSIGVNYGGRKVFTIKADPGYKIGDVKVDGISVGARRSYTFTNVTSNHTIEASFSPVTYNLSITKAGTGSGAVTSNPAGTIHNVGTLVTLNATPNADSTFVGWSGACSGPSETCTITMNVDVAVIATFDLKTYQLTIAWDPNTEPELAGYKLYYGYSSRSYEFSVDIGNKTSYVIQSLGPGKTYFFTATAYNAFGNESDFSEELSYTKIN